MNRKFNLVWLTLVDAAPSLVGFCLTFLLVFSGWTVLGHLIFGAELYEFSHFIRGFRTLFLMLLGTFEYERLRRVNFVWAPVFYIFYTFSMYFLFVNLFLSIVNFRYLASSYNLYVFTC